MGRVPEHQTRGDPPVAVGPNCLAEVLTAHAHDQRSAIRVCESSEGESDGRGDDEEPPIPASPALPVFPEVESSLAFVAEVPLRVVVAERVPERIASGERPRTILISLAFGEHGGVRRPPPPAWFDCYRLEKHVWRRAEHPLVAGHAFTVVYFITTLAIGITAERVADRLGFTPFGRPTFKVPAVCVRPVCVGEIRTCEDVGSLAAVADR